MSAATTIAITTATTITASANDTISSARLILQPGFLFSRLTTFFVAKAVRIKNIVVVTVLWWI